MKKQALTDLKLWKERLATMEAQQNLRGIEEALHARGGTTTEAATSTPSLIAIGGESLKWKESWMDRLKKKKRAKLLGNGVKKGH